MKRSLRLFVALCVVLSAPIAQAGSGDDQASEDDSLRITANGSPEGAATLQVPIRVPPGRRGMQPNLILTYNSRRQETFFGQGWDLSVPRIARSTRHGTPTDLEIPDKFELDGEPLVLAGPEGQADRYHTRRERFRRILFFKSAPNGGYWEVTQPDGVKMWFGGRPATGEGNSVRLYPSGTQAWSWGLDTVIDPFGNAILYSFVGGPQRELRLKSIKYTLNATSHPSATGPGTFASLGSDREVTLKYEQLHEDFRRQHARYGGGMEARWRNRATRIDVLLGGEVVRAYHLNYRHLTDPDDPTDPRPASAVFNQLENVQIEGRPGGGQGPLSPPIVFEYSPLAARSDAEQGEFDIDEELGGFTPPLDGAFAGLLDLNADGLLDRLRYGDARLGTGDAFEANYTAWNGTPTTRCQGANGEDYLLGHQWRVNEFSGYLKTLCMMIDVDSTLR